MTRRAFLALLPAALEPQEVKFRSDVNLVNVTFSARGPGGGLAGDLTREEIEILEDGVPQKIQFFARTPDLPLAIGLIVDSSGSQSRFTRRHRRDVKRFIEDVVGGEDRAFLLLFDNHLRLAADWTGSAVEILDAAEASESGGSRLPSLGPPEIREAGTAFYDSIYYAVRERLEPVERGRRVLVVFSDGEDNSSARHMIEAIEAAQGADALIYGVRYTRVGKRGVTARNKYGTGVMKRIAADTGGADYDASETDLEKVFKEISAELHMLYEAGYVASNPARDGTFRKLAVVSKRPGIRVRARSGYYAR